MYNPKGQLNRDALLKQYTPLVRRMAHYMIAKVPANVEVDDLIQMGMIGLADALTRYESGHGAQFETFATQRIRGSMIDELRDTDWLSRTSRKGQKDIERAIHKLEQRFGRSPQEQEIADEMNVSLPDYQDMLTKARGSQLSCTLHPVQGPNTGGVQPRGHTVGRGQQSARGRQQTPHG
jgi:RNA polymerase sigma factor for flagellar operon FliA